MKISVEWHRLSWWQWLLCPLWVPWIALYVVWALLFCTVGLPPWFSFSLERRRH